MDKLKNSFGARAKFDTGSGEAYLYRLDQLEKQGIASIAQLPFSMKIMLEAALRQCDGFEISENDVISLTKWDAKKVLQNELPFKPSRVVLQDFSGVPCLVDLAAMRSAVARLGGDAKKINPVVKVDLVVDHSVQVDYYGSANAVQLNLEKEFGRNLERYQFMRWGQNVFQNFDVVPPGAGIIHQVNLEYLAKVVLSTTEDGLAVIHPDTVVGTDSHTTMINGLGVVGWGVGGIEAEAVMLGQPLYLVTPEVIGVKLFGSLREGVTATDLTLTVVQMLRKKGVVEKFVEFYGAGLSNITLADRATIANMAPEYGATMGYFPIDSETLNYLRGSGRPADLVETVERYAKEQGLYRTDSTPDPIFTDALELDLSTVEPSIAGPKRPHDRIALPKVKQTFQKALTAPTAERGFGLKDSDLLKTAHIKNGNEDLVLKHGAVVIAAITSCTNTSNPSVMLGAGLLAQKAVEKGLRVPAYVKTSIAPGSRVVADYLTAAGVLPALEALGFFIVGYGCTTCIGNSGPIPAQVAQAVQSENLVASAVLSGNRNFEGRISPLVKANFLASPPLVVAYAIAGTTDIDIVNEPLGTGKDGQPVYLRDIWPSQAEIRDTITRSLNPAMYVDRYAHVREGSEQWQAIKGVEGNLYQWDDASTYIQEPPFFTDFSLTPAALTPIQNARVLGLFGDSVTTDHISPAGDIALDSPAGRYLVSKGIEKNDFNSYGARRGNDQVMLRGTFANIRLKNLLVPGVEGGVTVHMPSSERMDIYDAAVRYRQENVPLVILAGKEYGTGSSRDWAAKGAALLGVRAVIAESYERIHRNNLVGMGVLPLQYVNGQNAASLGLTGKELYSIEGIDDSIEARKVLHVKAQREDGSVLAFDAVARLDTPVEVNYYKNGGILQAVLRSMSK